MIGINFWQNLLSLAMCGFISEIPAKELIKLGISSDAFRGVDSLVRVLLGCNARALLHLVLMERGLTKNVISPIRRVEFQKRRLEKWMITIET